jgi:alpha-beta hydrolase superfamily lysophospholipase
MSSFMFGFVKCLAYLLPNLTLPNEGSLGGDILTHDPERRKHRLADPLIKSQVTTHWVREFIKARQLAFSEVGNISRPLGIFQAGDDKVVSRSDSEKFFDLLKVEKKLRIYEGWYHELSNEIDRAIFFKELFQWYQR